MTNNENKEYKIKLEYFDYKGDYCGYGEFVTQKSWMFEIGDEIKFMIRNKCLPNTEDNCDFTIFVDASEHPNGFPLLYHSENIDIHSNRNSKLNIKSENFMDKEYKIELEHFKSSGKHYTDGEFTTKELDPNKIFEEICKMKDTNELPGVGYGDFTVYIDASNHPNGFKKILFNK